MTRTIEGFQLKLVNEIFLRPCNTEDCLRLLFNSANESSKAFQSDMALLRKRLRRLDSIVAQISSEAQSVSQSRYTSERILIGRFVRILNSKKERIRYLEQQRILLGGIDTPPTTPIKESLADQDAAMNEFVLNVNNDLLIAGMDPDPPSSFLIGQPDAVDFYLRSRLQGSPQKSTNNNFGPEPSKVRSEGQTLNSTISSSCLDLNFQTKDIDVSSIANNNRCMFTEAEANEASPCGSLTVATDLKSLYKNKTDFSSVASNYHLEMQNISSRITPPNSPINLTFSSQAIHLDASMKSKDLFTAPNKTNLQFIPARNNLNQNIPTVAPVRRSLVYLNSYEIDEVPKVKAPKKPFLAPSIDLILFGNNVDKPSNLENSKDGCSNSIPCTSDSSNDILSNLISNSSSPNDSTNGKSLNLPVSTINRNYYSNITQHVVSDPISTNQRNALTTNDTEASDIIVVNCDSIEQDPLKFLFG